MIFLNTFTFVNARFLSVILSAVTISSIAAISLASTTTARIEHDSAHGGNATMTSEREHEETHVVRDSVFADLSDKVIPANDFVHFYDTTPYKIMDGHVAAKLPCDEQLQTPVQILIGQAPNMTATELENIPALSNPGQTCMYHADLHSPHANQTGTAGGLPITDIAIMNPTGADITFPNTSTLVIGVNEIMALGEAEHEHEAPGGDHPEEAGHE